MSSTDSMSGWSESSEGNLEGASISGEAQAQSLTMRFGNDAGGEEVGP